VGPHSIFSHNLTIIFKFKVSLSFRKKKRYTESNSVNLISCEDLMASRYLTTNGIQLHYLDHGGNGPNLVIAPGLTANAHFFNGLVAAGLTDHFHVYALDLRGRGRSDKPKTGYRMRDHAQDVIGFIEHLGLGSVVMAGHSFGGMLTYYMAARYSAYVDAAISMDAPAVVDERVREQIQPSLDRLERTLPSFETYLEMVKAMPYYDGWWDPMIEQFYRADVETLADGRVRSRCRPDNIADAVDGTTLEDWDALCHRIEVPVLFLRAPEPFGPPGSPPIIDDAKAELTMSRLKYGTQHDLPGNHITYLYGDGATQAVQTIATWYGSIGADAAAAR
jgi:pimeloyl-ACP methyl ester carboxylesterase